MENAISIRYENLNPGAQLVKHTNGYTNKIFEEATELIEHTFSGDRWQVPFKMKRQKLNKPNDYVRIDLQETFYREHDNKGFANIQVQINKPHAPKKGSTSIAHLVMLTDTDVDESMVQEALLKSLRSEDGVTNAKPIIDRH